PGGRRPSARAGPGADVLQRPRLEPKQEPRDGIGRLADEQAENVRDAAQRDKAQQDEAKENELAGLLVTLPPVGQVRRQQRENDAPAVEREERNEVEDEQQHIDADDLKQDDNRQTLQPTLRQRRKHLYGRKQNTQHDGEQDCQDQVRDWPSSDRRQRAPARVPHLP